MEDEDGGFFPEGVVGGVMLLDAVELEAAEAFFELRGVRCRKLVRLILRCERNCSPKSRFSRIRTINTPETLLSSASGFSFRGFHLSVPGIRPRMVMRVFEDRWTTRRRERIMLVTMPASRFHTTERTKVRVITPRSTQARILKVVSLQ